MQSNQEDLEATLIWVDQEFASFIYNPIKSQTDHPDTHLWFIAFVELVKYAFQFKEWTHTLCRQSIEDFEREADSSFLVYMNMFLESMDIQEKQSGKRHQGWNQRR